MFKIDKTNNGVAIESFGPSRPVLSFIVGVHGNERSPLEGAHMLRTYAEDADLKKGFRIIYANKKAIDFKKRFIIRDLNRSFPGDKGGTWEEKVAGDLMEEINKTVYNFDFHSSPVEIIPYGIVSVYNPAVEKAMRMTGIKNYVFDNNESLIKFARNGIAFEVGLEGAMKSAQETFRIMKHILVQFGAIEGEKNKPDGNVRIFLIYHFIQKDGLALADTGIKDFEYIGPGTILGKKRDGQLLIADEGFYPVLSNGPERILKAKEILIMDK